MGGGYSGLFSMLWYNCLMAAVSKNWDMLLLIWEEAKLSTVYVCKDENCLKVMTLKILFILGHYLSPHGVSRWWLSLWPTGESSCICSMRWVSVATFLGEISSSAVGDLFSISVVQVHAVQVALKWPSLWVSKQISIKKKLPSKHTCF